MKNIVLAIVLVFGIAQSKANTIKEETDQTCVAAIKKAEPPKGPLVIIGRAYIHGNEVHCNGGHRICAVIPRKVEDDVEVFDNIIIVYDEEGGVIGEYTFSDISISENAEGTSITWIP